MITKAQIDAALAEEERCWKLYNSTPETKTPKQIAYDEWIKAMVVRSKLETNFEHQENIRAEILAEKEAK